MYQRGEKNEHSLVMFFRDLPHSLSSFDLALPSSFEEGSRWTDIFSGRHAYVHQGHFTLLTDQSDTKLHNIPFSLKNLFKSPSLASKDHDSYSGMALWVLDTHPCLLSLPPLMDSFTPLP